MGSACGCAHAGAGPSSPAVVPRAARGCPPSATDVHATLARARPVHGERVVAFLAPGRGLIAFVAGRRVGGAVVRNRARRIMRAAWHEVTPRLGEGYDVVWVARASIRGAKTQDLVSEMNELLARARAVKT